MAQLVLKAAYNDELRKLTLPLVPAPRYEELLAAVLQRFQLDHNSAEGFRLAYRDEDGDWVTISSDEELCEMLSSLPERLRTVRMELRMAAGARTDAGAALAESSGTVKTSTANGAAETMQLSDSAATANAKEIKLEEGCVVEEKAVNEPATPALLSSAASPAIEDSAAPPLTSASERASLLAAAEFPPASSATVLSSSDFPSLSTEQPNSTSAYPDDSDAIPLPSSASSAVAPPAHFAAVPSALGHFFTALPSHATSLSSHLSMLLSSPDSALGRLSSAAAFRTSPAAGEGADLAASLAALRADVAGAVRELAQGVAAEAGAVRRDVCELKKKCDEEGERFAMSFRGAVGSACEPRSGGFVAQDDAEVEDEELSPVLSPSSSPAPSAIDSAPSSVASTTPLSAAAHEDALSARLVARAAKEQRKRERALKRAEKAERRARREMRAAAKEAAKAKRAAKEKKAVEEQEEEKVEEKKVDDEEEEKVEDATSPAPAVPQPASGLPFTVPPSTASEPYSAPHRSVTSPTFLLDITLDRLLPQLSPSTFKDVSASIVRLADLCLSDTTGCKLRRLVEAVVHFATQETSDPQLYARLCKALAEQISPDVADDGVRLADDKPMAGPTLLRVYLVHLVHEVYQAQQGRGVQLNRFIGELFLHTMLDEGFVHACIRGRLGVKARTPQDVEAVCALLQTVGKKLDYPGVKVEVDDYFEQMKRLGEVPGLPAYSRLMLQDLRDLRRLNWVTLPSVRGVLA
ncbi:hypothetical protein JCM10213_000846 [Rhodosporidiobolus nylandii]